METRHREVEEMIYRAWNAMVAPDKETMPDNCGLGIIRSNGQPPTRVYAKLQLAALAHIIAREGFGGKDRRIFQEDCPRIENWVLEVLGKRIIKTGRYIHGYGHQSYDGEYDWSPAYLQDEQTHCIYELKLGDDKLLQRRIIMLDKVDVLAENCEVVDDKAV